MGLPSINDFVTYINKNLTGTNWNSNLQKIIDFLTNGTYDLNVNSIETVNDLVINGDLNVDGTVIATEFVGDGSGITGLNLGRKNFIINGECLIKNNTDYTLVSDVYGTSVDRFDGMATGTTVDNGILTQITDSNVGVSGYAIKFEDVTITGAGEIYLRHRLYNKNAVIFKDQIASLSSKVYQDTGSSITYTIYINKADSLNNFTTVTEITNNGGFLVSDSTATDLVFPNISIGDASNGLEILIKVECGAVTLKNFEFTELQLELGATVSDFDYSTFNDQSSSNNIEFDGTLRDNIIGKDQMQDDSIGNDEVIDETLEPIKMNYTENFIERLLPSNANLITTLDITKGYCRDSTDSVTMVSNSDFSKDISSGWVAGTGNGGNGAASTLANSTLYYIFIIRDSSGNIDFGCDTDIDATNLLSTSGYTYYRVIGFFSTDSSGNPLKFKSYGHNDIEVRLYDYIEVFTTTPAAYPTELDLTNYVPAGMNTNIFFTIFVTETSGAVSAYLMSSQSSSGDPDSTQVVLPDMDQEKVREYANSVDIFTSNGKIDHGLSSASGSYTTFSLRVYGYKLFRDNI